MTRTLVILLALVVVVPAYADNNPFSGARSITVHPDSRHHQKKRCVRNWNYDYDQKVPILCKDK